MSLPLLFLLLWLFFIPAERSYGTQCIVLTQAEAFEDSAAVFWGEATSATFWLEPPPARWSYVATRFEVKAVWKGEVNQTTTVTQFEDLSQDLKRGHHYLIYAYNRDDYTEPGDWSADVCRSYSMWEARSHWEILGEEGAPILDKVNPLASQEGPQQHAAASTEPAARSIRNIDSKMWVGMSLLALSMLALGWLLGHKIAVASRRRELP